MARKKRSKHEEHDDSHRWIISYADFITLLFAFFVVMYAISSVNVTKYRSVANGMQTAFDKSIRNKSPISTNTHQAGQTAANTVNTASTNGSGHDSMESLDASLSNFADGEYEIKRDKDWIEMNIDAGALFDTGSADLKPQALVKLMNIAKILQKVPYPIHLEGYTDDIPISTPAFPSNWELSSARAAAIARALNNFGVTNSRMTVTGYGEQYPLADNDTEEGRSKNRRVSLVVARDKSVTRMMNPALSQPLRYQQGQ